MLEQPAGVRYILPFVSFWLTYTILSTPTALTAKGQALKHIAKDLCRNKDISTDDILRLHAFAGMINNGKGIGFFLGPVPLKHALVKSVIASFVSAAFTAFSFLG